MEKVLPEYDCDVLVIGGGPAGSTTAALLAEKGYRVVLLEKARHPRFHIGESLLPANLRIFEQLGVADEIRDIGMVKRGAEFISPVHDHTESFVFADAWDKSMPSAYQVRRSEFDHILIRNAARKGAEVIEGCRVRNVDFLPDEGGAEVRACHEDGREQYWTARFLVDASGRDTFIANKLKAKQRNPDHNSSAIYGHFEGARRLEGEQEGHISIFWFEHGWFWFIPLRDGATSVGATVWPYYLKGRDKPLDEFLLDTIALCPALADRLQDAKLVNKAEATGNFSYITDQSYGDNYLLVGDAFAFIDPVFSSGVMMAMKGAVTGVETIDTLLREPARKREALRRFDRITRHGPRQFSWFIYRITTPTMRDLFMAPGDILRVREALLSVLAGDIYDKTPIWPSVYAFKAIYYLYALRYLKRSWAAWRQRRRNIRPSDDLPVSAGT